MKSLLSLIGVVLIILGIGTLAYEGISYTQREKVAQIGNVQITADTEKRIYFPPILGGLSLLVGIGLVAAGAAARK